MPVEHESYKIDINGSWSLENLYEFPRAFEQVYFAMESLNPSSNKEVEERIVRAFSAYPWRGGYSTVNFFNQLKYSTPRERRPSVESIKYNSPGWIELILNLDLAYQIGGIVFTIAGSIHYYNKVYHGIYTDMQNRKLLRMEVESRKMELDEQELKHVANCADEMARLIGLPSAQALNERTHHPLISLKMLFSVYRRVRLLAEYYIKGKANLPSGPNERGDDDLFLR